MTVTKAKRPKIPTFLTEISTKQSTDTGMALVLVGLLAFLASRRDAYLVAATGLLLVDMIRPRFFVPVARIWFGFSAVLGAFMAKVMLTVIFVSIVCPVAAVRRMIGGDSMQLKKWKASRKSVFTERNHQYSTKDIDKPY